jgi:hypothetical protein
VYQADPRDLGYQGPCFCGRRHGDQQADGRGGQHGNRNGSSEEERTGAAAGTGECDPRTGPAATLAVLDASRRGDVGTEAARGGTARRPSALRPVPAPVTLVPAAAWEAGPDAHGDADDDVLRRALLRLIADAGTGARTDADADAAAGAGTAMDDRLFGAADRVRRRLDDALLGASVSANMLDQWEDTAAGYGRQYRSAAPLRLLCDVLLDLGDVRRMCEQRQPVEFSERLCRLAAKLAALVGMTMIDIGDQRLARAFFRTARIAADETGDRHLRGWVAVRASMVPLYYGDPGEAAQLARAGGELAGRGSCVAGVMAPVMEARALARLAWGARGNRPEALRRARAALDRAHLALGGLAGEVRSDTAFGYTERQILFHQGDTLITLGDHEGAASAFEQSLRMYPPTEILDRSLIMLGQARCRLGADEPEEALRLSRATVLALPRQHRPALVVRTARALGESVAAEHGDLPAVREYREALLAG